MEGKLLLAVVLQVLAKTGVHFLHDEHWQARASFQVHPQELDYAGVTQFGLCDAFPFEVAEEFLRSSWRLVFQQNLVDAFGSARSAIPFHLVHCSIGTSTEFGVDKLQFLD